MEQVILPEEIFEQVREARLALILAWLKENDRTKSWLANQIDLTRAGVHRWWTNNEGVPEKQLPPVSDVTGISLFELLIPPAASGVSVNPSKGSSSIRWDLIAEAYERVVDSNEPVTDAQRPIAMSLIYQVLLDREAGTKYQRKGASGKLV